MSYGIYMLDCHGNEMEQAWAVPTRYKRVSMMKLALENFYEQFKDKLPAQCICVLVADRKRKKIYHHIDHQKHWRNDWAILTIDGEFSTNYLA